MTLYVNFSMKTDSVLRRNRASGKKLVVNFYNYLTGGILEDVFFMISRSAGYDVSFKYTVAVVAGLKSLRDAAQVAAVRGKAVEEL